MHRRVGAAARRLPAHASGRGRGRRDAGPGFWIELGAHTCYNSYGALLELIEGAGLMAELIPRAKPILRLVDGDRVLPGKNLGALVRAMKWWQLATHLPRVFFSKSQGKTVREFYGGLVGKDNYQRVLGPMLSAVPSQPADDFPADMLFKKRERRKDVLRSFTLRAGLGALTDALARQPGIRALSGREARAITKSGGGYDVELADGERVSGAVLALATPPQTAARLVAGLAPELAQAIAPIGEASVDTLGVVVAAGRVALPPATFFIPRAEAFYSVVTRDVVPDPSWRGFVFHFRPGQAAADRRARAARFLGVPESDLADVVERRTQLPSPTLGHQARVAAIDKFLSGQRLALTGNWFAGLSLEDCALRSRAEWRRVAAD
ncbi:MAG: FAD-dependent oxidoreductase [Myxococcota bacterium]